MKVVHVHRIGGIGGSERHLLTLLPALRERDIDARFVGFDVPGRPSSPFYDALTRAEVPFTRLTARFAVDPRLVLRLRRAVVRGRVDILHTHLVHADVLGAAAVVGAPTRLVSTKHNDDPFRRGQFRHLERLITRRASRVICITDALLRFMTEEVGLPDAKLDVIHYGLDGPPGAWASTATDAVPAGARVVLGVMRLESQKDPAAAVRAFGELAAEMPELELVLLGEGPDRDRLGALARELGIESRVHMPGRVGDVAAWLERAELLVHPARWEGFGLVLLEAMHAGLPIVATRVSSIPEIVAHEETGLLVPAHDPGALAAAMRSLLVDTRRAALLGTAGQDRARRDFSVDRMVTATIATYERALSSAAR